MEQIEKYLAEIESAMYKMSPTEKRISYRSNIATLLRLNSVLRRSAVSKQSVKPRSTKLKQYNKGTIQAI